MWLENIHKPGIGNTERKNKAHCVFAMGKGSAEECHLAKQSAPQNTRSTTPFLSGWDKGMQTFLQDQ